LPDAGAPALYLAGPEVFLPDADAIATAKVAICASRGIVGRHPADAVAPLLARGDLVAGALGHEMYAVLVRQIDSCDGVLANLTPFRGPSADVGTVWEVGYAVGRGLPVFAYTNTTEHYAARVVDDGLLVEAFDFADNLMVEGAIATHGALIRSEVVGDAAARLRHLGGFERCVQLAADHFARTS
jgi:nucleoside 2-deoxyribosyltransferase